MHGEVASTAQHVLLLHSRTNTLIVHPLCVIGIIDVCGEFATVYLFWLQWYGTKPCLANRGARPRVRAVTTKSDRHDSRQDAHHHHHHYFVCSARARRTSALRAAAARADTIINILQGQTYLFGCRDPRVLLALPFGAIDSSVFYDLVFGGHLDFSEQLALLAVCKCKVKKLDLTPTLECHHGFPNLTSKAPSASSQSLSETVERNSDSTGLAST